MSDGQPIRIGASRGIGPRIVESVASRFTTATAEITLGRVLRIGAGWCFIGHGAFGLITKPDWIPYFGVVGISESLAYVLMPVVGMVDILAGLLVLVSPRPVALVYMVVWALWTALLRPLSGDTGWETVERAGNYGVPLALTLLVGGRDALRDWFAAVQPHPLSEAMVRRMHWTLRITTSLLFVGHGALAASGKPLLVRHFEEIGLDAMSLTMAGGLEIALAIAILARPMVALLIVAAVWKMATESLFIVAGAPIWEFIERAGSYVAPIALAMVMIFSKRRNAAGGVR